MLKIISRYGYRFLTSPIYRSYIYQLLRERSAPTENGDEFHLSANHDFSSLSGTRGYMCGGCELTFIGDYLKSVGLKMYHTFENGRPSEPLLEMSDPRSILFSESFDFIVLCQAQSFTQISAKIYTAGASYSDGDRHADLAMQVQQLKQAIQIAEAKTSCPIFVVSHFFVHGKFRGTHEYKANPDLTSYEEVHLQYTTALYQIARAHKNVYLLDVTEILEVEGKKRSLAYEERSGIFEHPTKFGARLIADKLLYQLLVLNPQTKRIKCVVFDLDNTLWRGVLREDGVENLYPIWSHLHVMRALAARGILLAVVSKNDPEEASLVEQILGKELFDQLVCVKLNWNPKSANIKQLAKELNIGIDSIAFFDDNPVEQEEVKANAPQVTVFDHTKIMRALEMASFEPVGLLTDESANRTLKYKEQAKRAAAETQADPADICTFLKSCHFKLDIQRPSAAMTTRVIELIQRTNQLNATGNRTTLAQLQPYLADAERYYAATASLIDKFGDYGMIGVCIAERKEEAWEILEFDFSCRAMGKQVEQALLTHLGAYVRRNNGKTISMQFKKSSRNAEMRSILKSFGFAAVEENEFTVKLSLIAADACAAYPEWLAVSTPVIK